MTTRLRAGLLTALCAFAWSGCQAGSTRFCDQQVHVTAAQQDKLFRFGAVIKAELDKSGQSLALISRSGLDLSRFGVRYSHAGLSLKASQNTPWSVRQLYYACDERKPRIYDQGMSGFVLGFDTPNLGYVSVVLLPAAEAAALESAALDNRQALQLLSTAYSANAYPYSQRYQNCNQWVMEMLASAWGRLGDGANDGQDDVPDLRVRAQGWLQSMAYTPSVFEVGPLMVFGLFIPWVHGDDHPTDDTAALRYRVSMPASIEAFVHTQVPGAARIEFCHNGRQIVIRRGWEPIAEGCIAGEQDTVVQLD